MDLKATTLVALLAVLVAGAWALGADPAGRHPPDDTPPAPSIGQLVDRLADPNHNRQTTADMLSALGQSQLGAEHVAKLLGADLPCIVRFAVERSDEHEADEAVRAALQALFSDAHVQEPEERWHLRMAAGRVLGADLGPATRARARVLLKRLAAAVTPGPFDARLQRRPGPYSFTLLGCVSQLGALGPSALAAVQGAGEPLNPQHAAALDMVRALLGEESRVPAVCRHLTVPTDPIVRWAAMQTLARLGDPATIPAIRRAVEDPFEWDAQSVFHRPMRERSIRELAIITLIGLGVDKDTLPAVPPWDG